MKRQYNYFYKITNNINQHFYYGVHCTDDLNDGYMGSGKRLHYAYKKYGMENFNKEILKFFDTVQEAYEYEAEVVNETLVKEPNCYNIQQGGKGWNTNGQAVVKDKNGKMFLVSRDDPRYISGELTGVTKGKVNVKDKDGNSYLVECNDPRYLSGELIPQSKGTITVKDKYNNFYQVPIDDPRYLSGELKYSWCGRKHKPETIEKLKQIHKEHKHQQGEKNSQYGTCWVYRLNENNKPISIKIKKEEIDNYIKDGWIKGRKIKGS